MQNANKKRKKQVLLINSAEYGKFYKNCLFYNSLYGNYMQDNMDLTEIDWKDVKVPYVQCDNGMPDPEILDMLLEMVYQLKPKYIVMIGGNSVFANLADNIVPVLAVGLSPSAMETTMVSYQTLTRKLMNRIFGCFIKWEKQKIVLYKVYLRQD